METISSFLRGLQEERRKTLASRMQPLVAYLDETLRVKTQEENNERMVGVATSDALQRAKQSGYADDEIEGFRQSLTGIKDPAAISGMYNDFEQGTQAKRILKTNGISIPDGISTPELVRMANESETKRQARMQTETRAKQLGTDGYKTYTDLIAQGADPDTALGEASNQMSIKESQTKANSQTETTAQRLGMQGYTIYRNLVSQGMDPDIALGEATNQIKPKKEKGGGGGGTKEETDKERKMMLDSKVEWDKANDGKTNLNEGWVYWKDSSGNKNKARVYVDGKGILRYSEAYNNEEVIVKGLNDLAVTKAKHVYQDTKGKTWSPDSVQTKKTKPKTADDFLKNIGF